MKLKDLIQRVLSQYHKGVHNDNTPLKPRHIYNKLITVRNLLIYQKVNKRQNINKDTYQIIDCVQMELASLHDCPCVPPSGCKFLRSKYPIPNFVSSDKPLINYISNINGTLTYTATKKKKKKYKKGNRYTSSKPDYFFKDDYLYITTPEITSTIVTIEAVFKDPLEARKFKGACLSCEDCPGDCESYLDLEFPIEASLEEPLILMTVEELVDKMVRIPNTQTGEAINEEV